VIDLGMMAEEGRLINPVVQRKVERAPEFFFK
jgi:hypothetical protein